MKRLFYLFVLLCLCSPAVRAAGEGVKVLVDDFENVGYGTKWVVISFNGPNLTMDIGSAAHGGHDGRGCAFVTIAPSESIQIEREFGKTFVGNGEKERLILPGVPTRVGLWLEGNNTLTRVHADVTGGTVDFGDLNYKGWRYVEKDMPPTHETPVRLNGLSFDAHDAAALPDEGRIYFDDLTIITTGTKEQPLFSNFEQMNLGRDPFSNEPFSTRLTLQNLLPAPQRLRVGVDLTTGKTLVMSHADTLKSQAFDVDLAPGEVKNWKFDYRMPSGIYNGYLSIKNRQTDSLIHDDRIEYRVFPTESSSGSSRTTAALQPIPDRDFEYFNSGLSPFVVARNKGPRLLLFQGMEPYGLGGPSHAAFMTAAGVQTVDLGHLPDLAGMSEAWMLFWYHGAKGWDAIKHTPYPIDVPMLVVFQHKPIAAKPVGSGVEFDFPAETGSVSIVPFYGVSFIRSSDTAKWDAGLPADVVERCRVLGQVSREYPTNVEESFKVDPVADVVSVRDHFTFMPINDDWMTPHRKVATLEYMTAMVNRAGWKVLHVDGKVLDLDLPVGQGLYAGVEGSNDCTYTLSGLLQYIDNVEQPKTIPADNPLLPEAQKNYDYGKAVPNRNYWWASVPLGNAASVAPFVPYLSPDVQSVVRLGTKQSIDYVLNPENLAFEYDKPTNRVFVLDGLNYSRMGWTDSGPTSNENLRNLHNITLGSGDKSLVKTHWPFIRSLYNVPVRNSHWGDSLFNAGGGDTFDSNLNGAISFARMAYWAGDDSSYRFACYHVAKQLLALYGVSMVYPNWVREKNMWATLEQGGEYTLKDENGKINVYDGATPAANAAPVDFEALTFSDLRGGNIGVYPWAMQGFYRPSNAEMRFMKDQMLPYARYFLQTFPKKYRPYLYQTAYVDQGHYDDKKEPHSPYSGKLDPVNNPRLEDYDFLFDTPLADRATRERKWLENNGGLRGHEFEAILAGIEQQYAPLWQNGAPPQADRAFRPGISEKTSSGAWAGVAFTATPKFQWPTLAWGSPEAPVQPALNSVGALPLGTIVPDPAKISFSAASVSPGFGMDVWEADYLKKPVLNMAGDLGKLPIYLQSLVIEHGVDRAEEHVKNMLDQSHLEWNIAGPFPYWSPTDFDKIYPPEVKIDLAADLGQYSIKQPYDARWQKVTATMYQIDFNSLYKHNHDDYVDNALGYGAIWVKSPVERDVKLAVGSDDGNQIWVNDKVVQRNIVHRGSELDQDIVPAHLRAGWNKILLKVFNRDFGNGWNFLFRITDDRLLPFGDLQFSSEPQG
ncbi:MAG: hypothetical protein M3Y56_00670 [Armatimonadota bacterium]|nr:hypothetical protein [Armatimonadota bacterium]